MGERWSPPAPTARGGRTLQSADARCSAGFDDELQLISLSVEIDPAAAAARTSRRQSAHPQSDATNGRTRLSGEGEDQRRLWKQPVLGGRLVSPADANSDRRDLGSSKDVEDAR